MERVRDVFLIGGGRDPDGVAASHRPFVEAAAGGPIAVLAEEDPDRWIAALRSAGATEVRVTADPNDLGPCAGVYVAGGHTPTCAARCVPGDWLPAAVAYAGFSAGAQIAAELALVGGWRVTWEGRALPVCPEVAGEDLDEVTLRPGLGLVPFVVDVHAAQWGTTTRLLHALPAGRTGLAIDEHTTVHVRDGELAGVHGLGLARRIRSRGPGTAEIT